MGFFDINVDNNLQTLTTNVTAELNTQPELKYKTIDNLAKITPYSINLNFLHGSTASCYILFADQKNLFVYLNVYEKTG